MGMWFFILLGINGILSVIIGFLKNLWLKIIFIVVIVFCLIFQGYYGLNEKKSSERYNKETLKILGKMSGDIDELKEKAKNELLTDKDWITIYYNAVDKIPVYFTTEEWRDSERLIYKDLLEEINGQFSMRGTEGSRIIALENFEEERNKLLQAKRREFNK